MYQLHLNVKLRSHSVKPSLTFLIPFSSNKNLKSECVDVVLSQDMNPGQKECRQIQIHWIIATQARL